MKIIKTLGIAVAVLALASCGNSTENTTTAEPPAETAPPAKKQPEPVPGTKENPDHTEIGVDESGVSYSKKRGNNETDVKVRTDSSSIRIRKKN